MPETQELKFDTIGYWSEIKLEIIKKYASAYSRILSTSRYPFYYIYVDAFAGAGQHYSRTTGNLVDGSPLVALNTEPPFKEIIIFELNSQKTNTLIKLIVNVRMSISIQKIAMNIYYKKYCQRYVTMTITGL
jgi:three-Cys-motif partner protein